MAAEEVGERPMQGPFNAALAQAAGGAVMVPWVAEWLSWSAYPKLSGWSVINNGQRPTFCSFNPERRVVVGWCLEF